jgi:hypothetical protein
LTKNSLPSPLAKRYAGQSNLGSPPIPQAKKRKHSPGQSPSHFYAHPSLTDVFILFRSSSVAFETLSHLLCPQICGTTNFISMPIDQPICPSPQRAKYLSNTSGPCQQYWTVNDYADARKSSDFSQVISAYKIHYRAHKTGDSENPKGRTLENSITDPLAYVRAENQRLSEQNTELKANLEQWKSTCQLLRKAISDLKANTHNIPSGSELRTQNCAIHDSSLVDCSTSPPCLSRISILLPKEVDKSLTNIIKSHGG